MKNYVTLKEQTGVVIKEAKTESLIRLKVSRERIYDICKRLNSGSGFGGQTPDFFLQTFKG
jgi:hypothetical protein